MCIRDRDNIDEVINIIRSSYDAVSYTHLKGSMKFFNNYTNIELEKDLIIADVYDLGEDVYKRQVIFFAQLLLTL